ncbi:Poly U specific endoribonuclease-B [Taenia crassiceps]|uniref:Uridylate-specific endoribonuclease n=1 Tax=Taenia crassiceps TaxID=6207 RepID=A0ABR4Q3N6_9CEST
MSHLYVLLAVTLLAIVPANAEVVYTDADLAYLVSRIWIVDPNRLRVGKDIQVDWQGVAGSKDAAPKTLIASTSKCFKDNAVSQAFVALLDNYNLRVGFPEVETPEKRKEIDQFLDALLNTTTMRSFHTYLVSLRIANPVLAEFKAELYRIWFASYKRQTKGDSSPFEHVFVGEAKGKKLLGMNSWITFCLKEKEGLLNYYGYNRQKARLSDFRRSIRFDLLNDYLKSRSTIVLGSSVEFEFGLFTTIFLRAMDLFYGRSQWPPFLVNLWDKNAFVNEAVYVAAKVSLMSLAVRMRPASLLQRFWQGLEAAVRSGSFVWIILWEGTLDFHLEVSKLQRLGRRPVKLPEAGDVGSVQLRQVD